MKSQEKNHGKKNINQYTRNILSGNLKYLFKLNKQKNNFKIIDFCRKTGINQNTITAWMQTKQYPTRTNTMLIVDYFNQSMGLSISVEDITGINVESITTFVKEQKSNYLTEDERLLLEKYRKLAPHKKDTIKNLLKDFE